MWIQTDEQWVLVTGTACKTGVEGLYQDLKACNGRGMNMLIQKLPFKFIT